MKTYLYYLLLKHKVQRNMLQLCTFINLDLFDLFCFPEAFDQ